MQLPLVVLAEGGGGTPLFLVHPPGGSVSCYVHLASSFPPDRPVYGIQAPGLEGETTPLATVEAMAECYVEAVRRVCPEGPLCVAGWSGGGFIALEMAQRWQAAGGTVGMLAMLDTPCPAGPLPEQPVAPVQADSDFYARLIEEYLGSLGVPMPVPVEELARLEPEQQIERLLDGFGDASIPIPEDLRRQARQLPLMAQVTRQACRVYRASYYQGRVTLLRAGEGMGHPEGEQHFDRWRETAAEVHTVVVPGDHRTMVFNHNHARQVGAALQAAMPGDAT